jgi:uncharacterized protein YndB with AHSA1/START domain
MTNPDASFLKVRRSIHIKAAPERVWQAFTSKARMDDWWGLTMGSPEAGTSKGQWLTAFEPRVGGRIEMAVMLDGKPVGYGGVIKTFASRKELTFENDWIPNQGWAAPTYMTLRLTGALGGTLVELFHHGFEHTGGDVSAEHSRYEAGWGMMQLTALKTLVEGEL